MSEKNKARAIYLGLAVGTLIGGLKCAHDRNLSYNTPNQTIESKIDNSQSANQTKNADQSKTVDYNQLINKPVIYGNRDYLLCDGYDKDTRTFSVRYNKGRVYMNFEQYSDVLRNSTFISMSSYNGYMSSHYGYGTRMTTRPPRILREWNSINLSAGYRPSVDTSYVKHNNDRFVNKVKTWLHNHKKNK